MTPGHVIESYSGSFVCIRVHENQTACARAIKTSRRTFEQLNCRKIIYRKHAEVGIPSRIRHRQSIPVNLHIPHAKWRTQRASAYVDAIACGRALLHSHTGDGVERMNQRCLVAKVGVSASNEADVAVLVAAFLFCSTARMVTSSRVLNESMGSSCE